MSTEHKPLPMPQVREVTFDDLGESLRAGIADFRRAPLYGLFFGGVYTLGGLVMYWMAMILDAPWLIIPLAISFPLFGPFAAVGLYDVSRRLEAGEPLSWGAVLGVVLEQRRREIVWIAYVILFISMVWFFQFKTIMAVFLAGESFSSIDGFLTVALTTESGLTFLIVGAVVGGFLAFILFASTVISIPLLLERDRDVVTAIITSWKVVQTSLRPMLAWGVMVTAAVMLGALSAFLGFLVILPVLGHATWHLYRRAVAPQTAAEADATKADAPAP